MRNLHIISHTHWDREWYLTFQQFRLKLIQLVDGLLDILDKDPEFKYFMLDGQTIVLEDYLSMRPEKESILREHIRSGRIIIGPWHILPDMFLVGPEAHIRNLLEGERTTRKFGPRMMVGYMPDSFGHIGQMPQILRGFDIHSACLWRGLDEEPAEFWWQAPDGSRVLMAYLRDSYSNGALLPAGSPVDETSPTGGESQVRFSATIAELGQSLAEHSAAQDQLIMLGTDHMQPPLYTSEHIAYADEMLGPDTHVLHSTLENYLAALTLLLDGDLLATVSGELRNSKRMPLLPGVLSTRMWIKQRNSASENLLTKWVEPFSSFADWQAVNPSSSSTLHTRLRQPAEIIRQAWRLLMENHPHDSICGCSLDQVHAEMKVRFDQVDQIGEELTRQSLEALASRIQTNTLQDSVVVFNPSPHTRSDLVSAEISLGENSSGFELSTDNGEILTYETQGLGATDLVNTRMNSKEFRSIFGTVSEGRVTGFGIRAYSVKREGSCIHLDVTLGETEPDLAVWRQAVEETNQLFADPTITEFHVRAHTPNLVRILFTAPQVPGLGWRSFNIQALTNTRASQPLPALARAMLPLIGRMASLPAGQRLIEKLQSDPGRKPPYIIENEFFRVELESTGTITVLDKISGGHYTGLNRFVDSGDSGDEYNYSPPSINPQYSAHLKIASIQRGRLRQTLTLELLLKIPVSLAADRKSRSQTLVEIPIRSKISLCNGVPRIEIHTHIENNARDHRLRVHFPAPFLVENATHDGHFEFVQRRIGIPAFDRQTWVEDPRPEVPQRAFSRLQEGERGLMLANRGLPEIEALKTKQGSELALTLLRCVGWLSRDDLQTRRGHAGPGLETPGAQMSGAWDFEYALIPYSSAATYNAVQQAYDFETPLRAVIHPTQQSGDMPGTGTFIGIRGKGFVLSSLKAAQDNNGWILRGYNPSPDPIRVDFSPQQAFRQAARVNLAEQKLETLQFKDGSLSQTIQSNEILSLWFGN